MRLLLDECWTGLVENLLLLNLEVREFVVVVVGVDD